MAVGDSAITTPDGSDTISEFDLGTDMLTFVVTSGTPPTATADASALDALMEAFDSVAIVYDDNETAGDDSDDTYTGITFGIDGTATLSVTFATALNADALADALGSTIADAAALPGIFANGVPTQDSDDTTLSAAGEMLIDTLFGAGTISVEGSLPTELL